jgi:cytochrome b subunit of formate dehydrogenase
MGVIAGLYFGKKIIYNGIPMIERPSIIKRVAAFTGIIMFVICLASGLIAFIDQYTGKDLQGMLGLQFEVSKAMIMAIILVGGLTLIIAQYFLTKIVMMKTIKYYESNAS